ncbi:MAG: ADP-ribosylglycohydrolase family protein [Planctomycetes bacterium]|nr:ADP-ribosylglycohydrolase family protein [Planctomycetota bacterium]
MNLPSDRCRGVLLGLAAGDRNGGPLCMAVRLAESLHACGRFDSADVLSRYLAWWYEGAFDTGPVSGRVLELLAQGIEPAAAVEQVHRESDGQTAGCNPSHRSAPLAMLAQISDDDLGACARDEAQLTHYDPLAGDIAATVSLICRGLIRGQSWSRAIGAYAAEFLATDPPFDRNGFSPRVLRAALYFVDRAPSFREALDRSVEFAGAANYCPVLVGAIGGARWGAGAIEPQTLIHVSLLPRVAAAAEVLAAGW